MTINLDELKKQLRERSGKYDEYDWHSDIEIQAADAIEQLQRELNRHMEINASLATGLEEAHLQLSRKDGTISIISSALSSVEREGAKHNSKAQGLENENRRLKLDLEDARSKYSELIFAVGLKHKNETRHETALRYIRQMEIPKDTAASQQKD